MPVAVSPSARVAGRVARGRGHRAGGGGIRRSPVGLRRMAWRRLRAAGACLGLGVGLGGGSEVGEVSLSKARQFGALATLPPGPAAVLEPPPSEQCGWPRGYAYVKAVR